MPAYYTVTKKIKLWKWQWENYKTKRIFRKHGIIFKDGFNSTGIPLVYFNSLCDAEVNIKDFYGSIVFEKNTGINSGIHNPFPHPQVRLTVMKTAPGKVGFIFVGEGTTLNATSITAYEKVTIGKKVLFGPNVIIMDCDGHPPNRNLPETVENLTIAPITIGNNVWIGYGAVILKGVTIGDNSIIGINSIVTKSVPPNSIAVGQPAKVIKTY